MRFRAHHFVAVAALVGASGELISPAAAQEVETAPTTAEPKADADARPKAIEFIKKEADDESVFKFDFGVPSSPALNLLGLEKDGVAQANSLKPIVFTMPDVLSSDESGTAGAIEIAPAWLFTRTKAHQYRDYSPILSALYRTRLGAAIAEGVADTDPAKQRPSRLAVGFSTSLLPNSDPLLARVPGGSKPVWQNCIDNNKDDIWAGVPHFTPTAEMNTLTDRILVLRAERRGLERIPESARSPVEQARFEALADEIPKLIADYDALENRWRTSMNEAFKTSEGAKVIETCKQVADRAARVGADLDIGGGLNLNGTPGEFSGYKDPTAVFWGSFRTSVGVTRPKSERYHDLRDWVAKNDRWFMVGASGRVALSEAVATGDAAKPLIRANNFTGWAGLESYTEKSRFALQLGLQRTDPRSAADSALRGNRFVYIASFDQRVLDGIWLSLSYGRAEGNGSLKGDSTTRLSLVLDTPDVRKIFGD